LHSVIVFPNVFPKAYISLEEGKAFQMEINKTKEEDLVLQEIVG
jgi:hypothetical protein